jgi:hypothetical protein
VHSVIQIASNHGGTFAPSPNRSAALNCVYVIASVHCGFCYVGETSSGTREFTHFSRRTHEHPTTRAHDTMRRVGLLPFDFPASFDRKAFEAALITRFDHYGKFLLNVKGRKSRKRVSNATVPLPVVQRYRGTLTAPNTHHKPPATAPTSLPPTHPTPAPTGSHTSVTAHRSNPTKASSRKRHQRTSCLFRPFRRLLPPAPSLQPCRIPAAVWFSGGAGCVTCGLLKSGHYDVRVAIECDTAAAGSHRLLYPSVPVLRYELGGPLGPFFEEFAKFIPPASWPQLAVQASPPCCLLSRSNKHSVDVDKAMHHTR